MPATSEQLLARWETTEGQQLADQVRRSLIGQKGQQLAGVQPLNVALVVLIAALPFADEISPRIDLRGLHVQAEDNDLSLKYIDLSNVRLDYAYEIDRIIGCLVQGAVFDHAHSINGMFFRESLNGISLIGASFNGAMLQRANLESANLQGAHLVVADLSNANCTNVQFGGADLRFTDLHGANLAGADLREANLTEANLGDVVFDEQTRVQGANLYGALLSPDFRAFAQQSGAQLNEEQTFTEKSIVELDATARVLGEHNADGHLTEAIEAVEYARDLLRRDPTTYNFGDALDEAFARAGSPAWVDEVWETWNETSSALAYYV